MASEAIVKALESELYRHGYAFQHSVVGLIRQLKEQKDILWDIEELVSKVVEEGK